MKRLNPKRGGWKREGVVGGGFKGTRVGGGGESGSARPETDGGQRWAPGAAHKGEQRGPARVPGEEKTAPGPNPLGSHNGVFHGVSGGAAEADAGRRRRCPLAGAEPRAPPPPRTPKGPALGWGRCGRRRRVGSRGARRLSAGPVCGSGARRRGRKGRARFGRGGRGRERGRGGARLQSSRRGGWRASGGRAGGTGTGSESRDHSAPRAGTGPSNPEARPWRAGRRGPGGRAAPAACSAPLAPAPSRGGTPRSSGSSPGGGGCRCPAAGPSGSRAAAAGCVCASVPRSRPMPGTCVKASCAQSPSHTLLSK